MDVKDIAILVLSMVCIVLIILLIMKNKKSNTNVRIVDDVRYKTNDNGVSHLEGDILLSAGTTYKVKKGDYITPGIYKVLKSTDDSPEFNIRLGGFVRTYKDGNEIVLNEGDEICAVSHPVILR